MNNLQRRYLAQQQELGHSVLYFEPAPAANISAEKTAPSPPAPAAPAPSGDKAARLEALYAHHQQCQNCRLGKTRNRFVFGSGSPDARLLFIGEAPGADEDEQGLPFVGRAGQLLTKMIESGMGIPRSTVYIANILKCRPPGNRDPQPDERAACTPILLEQIRIIQPEFICCLGRISGRFLLKLDDSVLLKEMRQKFYDYEGTRVCVTYHPSALLQHPGWKVPAWEDLQFLMAAMGLVIPKNIK
ncbi:MAG: uracil-DNA glycosylase [Fibrobacterota bacterium]